MADGQHGNEAPVPSVRLKHAAATHVGLLRKTNEDSYVAEPGLYVVCDGMGGAQAGEVASATACRKVLEAARTAPDPNGLRRAVRAANREVYRMSLADPALQGMGTTLTAALSLPGRLLIAHVGDSRAYLLRDGELQQVTEDHSLVAEMVRRGQLTAEQAAVHPHRSIITRALGTEESVEPDLIEIELQPDDRVLLCTDGLSGMVDDALIAGVLTDEAELEGAARRLVEAALEGGGEDNVTVLLLEAQACEEESAGPFLGAAGAVEETVAEVPGGDDSTAGSSAVAVAPGGVSTAAPRGRRRVRRRALLGAGAALSVGALALLAFLLFNSSVYWVGTAEGQVALYQGLPYRVLGVDLYDLTEVRPTSYTSLESHVKDRIEQRELMTKEEGLRFVRNLPTTSSTVLSTSTTAGPTSTTARSPSVSPRSTSSTFRSTSTTR